MLWVPFLHGMVNAISAEGLKSELGSPEDMNAFPKETDCSLIYILPFRFSFQTLGLFEGASGIDVPTSKRDFLGERDAGEACSALL